MTFYQKHKAILDSIVYPFHGYRCNIYFFGSMLKSDQPNDLDILLVFHENISEKEHDKILELKSKMRTSYLNKNFHWTVLSFNEHNEDLNFLREIKQYYIKIV